MFWDLNATVQIIIYTFFVPNHNKDPIHICNKVPFYSQVIIRVVDHNLHILPLLKFQISLIPLTLIKNAKISNNISNCFKKYSLVESIKIKILQSKSLEPEYVFFTCVSLKNNSKSLPVCLLLTYSEFCHVKQTLLSTVKTADFSSKVLKSDN